MSVHGTVVRQIRVTNVCIAALSMLLGCARDSDIRAVPEQSTPITPAPLVDRLVGHEGEVISIEGRVAPYVTQHLSATPNGKSDVDVIAATGSYEFVAYVEKSPVCTGNVLLTGKVVKVSGKGKGGEPMEVMQLDVSSWSCRRRR